MLFSSARRLLGLFFSVGLLSLLISSRDRPPSKKSKRGPQLGLGAARIPRTAPPPEVRHIIENRRDRRTTISRSYLQSFYGH